MDIVKSVPTVPYQPWIIGHCPDFFFEEAARLFGQYPKLLKPYTAEMVKREFDSRPPAKCKVATNRRFRLAVIAANN